MLFADRSDDRYMIRARRRLGCLAQLLAISLSIRPMSSTPTVTIHVYGQLRMYCGGASQLSVSAGTVRAALDDLERSQTALYRNLCDETGRVRKHLNVFVNADNVRDLNGVDTPLSPGDV